MRRSIPGFPDEQRRVLAVETAGLRVIDLYVPNGQALDSDKYDYKLRWLAALRTWLAGEAQKHPNLVVLGDFNIAPEDRDVHDPKAWEGGVHVSPAERASLRELLDARLRRRVPPLRAAREELQLVGLPGRRVPSQSRPAHRPDPRERRVRATLYCLHDRSRAAPRRTSVRSHARDRDL